MNQDNGTAASDVVEAKCDVGAFFAEREKVNARLVRSLAANGAWNMIDAIYGDAAPAVQRGSSPRLKAVA